MSDGVEERVAAGRDAGRWTRGRRVTVEPEMPRGRFEHLEFDDDAGRQANEEAQNAAGRRIRTGDDAGLLSAQPMDSHAYHQQAIRTFQRGEFDKALRLFTRGLQLERAFVPAWVGQVQMLIELEELREADLWADKALELFRGQGELLAAKGVAKARLGERGKAMECSDASLSGQGSSAYRWLARGEVLLAAGGMKAGVCFDRALLEGDADWFTRVWAARIYRRHNQRTNALVLARQATDSAPHEPYAWYIRGLCERDLAVGAYRASFERALEIDGSFHPARDALYQRAEGSWLRRLVRRIARR